MDPLTIHRRPLAPDLVRALDPGACSDPSDGFGRGGAPHPSPRDRDGSAAVGSIGEALAVHHLVADDGLEILARNWRLAAGELRGELDVVARDRTTNTLIVVEVKTRRDAARFGGAVTALHPRQIARLRRVTTAFVRQAGLRPATLRLDLVAIDLGRAPSLQHVPEIW